MKNSITDFFQFIYMAKMLFIPVAIITGLIEIIVCVILKITMSDILNWELFPYIFVLTFIVLLIISAIWALNYDEKIKKREDERKKFEKEKKRAVQEEIRMQKKTNERNSKEKSEIYHYYMAMATGYIPTVSQEKIELIKPKSKRNRNTNKTAEKSTLNPYLRNNLDILFVGLNPAKGSSLNHHYFSVNQAFWNQLYSAGLIISKVDKALADEIIFGTTDFNFSNWSYGITDLVTEIAESNSSKIKPTLKDCDRLKRTIIKYSPRVVVLLHGKVLDCFLQYLRHPVPSSNSGELGYLIDGCPSMFYNIAFPHGNTITSEEKVIKYKAVKNYLAEPY